MSWFSRKQQSVALSSAEAESMAASLASCEAIWLRKMLFGLFGQALRPFMIYCDNQSCIKLTENPFFHDRSKHIEIKYHFIRDYVQKGAVKLEYISTNEQVADILLILDSYVQTPCCDAQMKMPIFLLDSSFGEVQDRSKDHLDPMSRTFILNLFKICAGRP